MINFVGAGPGDVDLITVKGRRLLEEADLVIYAGSLVSKEHLDFCKKTCEFHNSASMTLEEVIEKMEKAIEKNLNVVRLHTGDPTIYGAIREQMDILEDKGIDYNVIPGVSSFTAACASIKREFTLPDISQTIILTRIKGRTPVPEDEDLAALAKHNASMAIFLSVQSIGKVVDKLIEGYGRDSVPVAVVYKASWEDEKIILGTLKNIEEKVKKENIAKTAQILVGDFIEGEYERSKLYDPNFTHEYREWKTMKIACLSFTDKGRLLGEKLKYTSCNKYTIDHYPNRDVDGGVKKLLKSIWLNYDGIIFISATGIAMRMSAPFLKDKTIDPAIVVIDDLGRYSISLLSGHIGRANELAKDMAKIIEAKPIITTATDGRGIESIDVFAQNNEYYIEDIKSLTKITSMMVNEEKVGLYTEDDRIINYNKLQIVEDLEAIAEEIKGLIIVSSKRELKDINIPYTILRPKNINIGVGCRKGVDGQLIIDAIEDELNKLNLLNKGIKSMGTIEVKKDEKGIIEASKYFKCPLKIFTIEEIREVEDNFFKSEFVKDTIGVYSVSGPAAFLQGGNLISEKSKYNGITISISKEIFNG